MSGPYLRLGEAVGDTLAQEILIDTVHEEKVYTGEFRCSLKCLSSDEEKYCKEARQEAEKTTKKNGLK